MISIENLLKPYSSRLKSSNKIKMPFQTSSLNKIEKSSKYQFSESKNNNLKEFLSKMKNNFCTKRKKNILLQRTNQKNIKNISFSNSKKNSLQTINKKLEYIRKMYSNSSLFTNSISGLDYMSEKKNNNFFNLSSKKIRKFRNFNWNYEISHENLISDPNKISNRNIIMKNPNNFDFNQEKMAIKLSEYLNQKIKNIQEQNELFEKTQKIPGYNFRDFTHTELNKKISIPELSNKQLKKSRKHMKIDSSKDTILCIQRKRFLGRILNRNTDVFDFKKIDNRINLDDFRDSSRMRENNKWKESLYHKLLFIKNCLSKSQYLDDFNQFSGKNSKKSIHIKINNYSTNL